MDIILTIFVYIPAVLFYILLLSELYKLILKKIKRKIKRKVQTEILDSFRNWKGSLNEFEEELETSNTYYSDSEYDDLTTAEITASDLVAYEDNRKRK
ncbi:TPA: hypothetical protein NNQ64_004946 [Salmonella enterica]|uniref:hypothetical protein n=1 Tax=Salmonella enterica TaxID=28901 RepID=UPI001A035491|nr:hypothetical protein [Salmonella enterica]ECJ6667935.1 hypothetical protein [Salmonella enterica subsp. enterica]EHN8834946.1 hypothetical protein [Enterobacter hormaechei]EFQ9276453.1 hypothetical protein [Salmonella enterica]EGP6031666.1 hypothetical protein [Salmonella enterica]ELA6482854.1 hypothetical protein [Salmonella enterica]